MPDDPIIYIVIYDNGEVAAWRKREDAEDNCEDGEIKEAYLQ